MDSKYKLNQASAQSCEVANELSRIGYLYDAMIRAKVEADRAEQEFRMALHNASPDAAEVMRLFGVKDAPVPTASAPTPWPR